MDNCPSIQLNSRAMKLLQLFCSVFLLPLGEGMCRATHICRAVLSLKSFYSPSSETRFGFILYPSSTFTDSVSLGAWGRAGFKNTYVEKYCS